MSNPNPITTHVLNTSSGSPASGMNIVMEKNTSSNDREPVWEKFGNTVTNADGRGPGLISAGQMSSFTVGLYRMTFFTQDYFDNLGIATFYPKVDVVFRITDVSQHYHIPLLISPFGYSTYRGS